MPKSLHILLIDDDGDIAFLIGKSLERTGHRATVCPTGADALRLLQADAFDLALLSQNFIVTDGLLNAFHRAGVAFVVTGPAEEQLAINALRGGALDYIKKDVALTFLADLPKRVEDALDRFRERKAMERQLYQAQKMQSVGTLASGVAHEFNNLLAGIQGYATLGLRENGVSEPVKELLGNIVSLSDRAARLTRQLLAFARRPTLVRQPTQLDKLVRATMDLVKDSLKIDARAKIDESDKPWIALADANELQQVLVNLALNARDAMTSPQPVELRLSRQVLADKVSAFPEDVPVGDYLLIEVQDRGSGMTDDVLRQALDPFFTTKEVGKGTGLGLSVASGIIHGHQGFLTIQTEVGRGTCMRIYLPRTI